MKIQPKNAEAFVRQPDPAIRAVLVYGPDRGLVRERAAALVAAVVPDPGDPFRVAELGAAEVAKAPGRLADEAAALAFDGGRRVVRLRDAEEGSARALGAFLDNPAGEALVVVEAGDLEARARLRQVFEKSSVGAALACYRDEPRALAGLIREALTGHGLGVTREAVDYLAAHLGGDRLVTRSELEKLALYKGSGEVDVADARACVGDTASITLEDAAFACADGDLAGVERAFQRALQEGAAPVQPLRAVARHFQRLHAVAGAGDLEAAIGRLRPPVFWKRKAVFKAEAAAWTPAALGTALERLLEAEARVKTTGVPAEAVASRALLEIAHRSPLRQRRPRGG